MLFIYLLGVLIVLVAIPVLVWWQVDQRLGFVPALICCIGLGGYAINSQWQVEKMFSPCQKDQSISGRASRLLMFSSTCPLPSEYSRPDHLKDPMAIGLIGFRNFLFFYLSTGLGIISTYRFAKSKSVANSTNETTSL